ncbi:MAG TPA: DUF2085 domain-containing protein, partial [Anaerolineaceae bacterium]|nr:DUF2085 domain-containing protein [Anaerolineaceae bacterium]
MEIPSTENRVVRLGKWALVILAGVLWVSWLLNTPQGIFGKADAIGYAVCHRIDARSFHIGTRQLPLCARCSGMYLGAVVGILYQFYAGRRRGGLPSKWMMAFFALLAAAFAVDGLNSYAHFFPRLPSLYQPNNILRLFTGSGMGLAISAFLFPVFNQTLW